MFFNYMNLFVRYMFDGDSVFFMGMIWVDYLEMIVVRLELVMKRK